MQPTEQMPSAARDGDHALADVVDLVSNGRRSSPEATPPADEVASGRRGGDHRRDFLGSRPATASDSPAAPVFEFPPESARATSGPDNAGQDTVAPHAADLPDCRPADVASDPPTAGAATAGPDDAAPDNAEQDDGTQDFFDRWGPRQEEPVAQAQEADTPTAASPVVLEPDNGPGVVRGLAGPRAGQRFLREVSAARESQDPTRAVEARGRDAHAGDDTVPPEWFASTSVTTRTHRGMRTRTENTAPGPTPLPGGRPAPGSA